MKDIYVERVSCCACHSKEMDQLFLNEKEYETSLSLSFTDTPSTPIFMPFNLLICKKCNTSQTKYLGNLSIIYSKNHIDNSCTLKSTMHDLFADFVGSNKDIQGIIEFGACNELLATKIREIHSTPYSIVEPSFTGNPDGIQIIPSYLEDFAFDSVPANTVLMSHLFEHIYEPIDFLKRIADCPSIIYIYLNHPDFEYNVRNDVYVVLNSEHIYYMEHSVLIAYFEKFGFFLTKRFDYIRHSIFLEFTRQEISKPFDDERLVNENVRNDIVRFYSRMQTIVTRANEYMQAHPEKKYYIWPASAHSICLFACGFDTSRLHAILDNSPNKIGKYLHSYNLLCKSFQEILGQKDKNVCIFLGGAGQYAKEISTQNTDLQIVALTDDKQLETLV